MPDWARELLSSGEAVACLSLAGNHAVKLVADDVGGAVEYSVRTMQAGELTPVAGPFVYACDGVFGGEKGKAVVFRPHHDPSLVIVAFRGVRTQVAPADDVEPRYSTPGDGGASDGGGSSTNSSFTKAAPRSRPPSPRTAGQKPPLGASADAAAADEKGDALAEQAAIDRANFVRVECAEPGWLSGSALRVHAGVLDHHESLWDSRPGSRGLVDWVADQISREPAQRVVFVGLSFGGALAQLTAYRVARVYPSLRDSLHVLAMGSVQWANALMARHARNVFGDRVVNLVTTRVVSLAATPEAARARAPPPRRAAGVVGAPRRLRRPLPRRRPRDGERLARVPAAGERLRALDARRRRRARDRPAARAPPRLVRPAGDGRQRAARDARRLDQRPAPRRRAIPRRLPPPPRRPPVPRRRRLVALMRQLAPPAHAASSRARARAWRRRVGECTIMPSEPG